MPAHGLPAHSLIEAFRAQLLHRGECPALTAETSRGSLQRYSWGELGYLIDSAAERMEQRFAQDRSLPRHIGHLSDNSLSDVVIALACMSLGAVEFPFDHRLPASEVQRRWNSIGGLWIDDRNRRQFLDGATGEPSRSNWQDAPIDLDAPALVLWTSGTTGTPRGVTLSQRNLCGNAQAKLTAVPQTVQDVRLCVLPLSHAYARTCDLGTWLLSGCEMAIAFGYAGLQRLAPRVTPTLINAVPSVAYRMLADRDLRGLERLRLLGCGGAAMSTDAFEAWRRRGVTVIQGYGLTETSPVICSATPEDARAGFVGRLVEGWEADIRDQQLWVRGPHVMLGYWQDPEATAKKIDREGWLSTGDLVEPDPLTRQMRILGRADDVIVLDSARKVHPAAVERAVEQVAGVRHAMLVQLPRRKGRPLELWIDAEAGIDRGGNEQKQEQKQKYEYEYEYENEYDLEQEQAWRQTECEIRDVLAQIEGLAGCAIQRFRPPLRESDGELTHKGTIRRSRILKNRFPERAGS